MKKVLLLGGLAAAAMSLKRRKAGAKADSDRLWSEAVSQPGTSTTN